MTQELSKIKIVVLLQKSLFFLLGFKLYSQAECTHPTSNRAGQDHHKFPPSRVHVCPTIKSKSRRHEAKISGLFLYFYKNRNSDFMYKENLGRHIVLLIFPLRYKGKPQLWFSSVVLL